MQKQMIGSKSKSTWEAILKKYIEKNGCAPSMYECFLLGVKFAKRGNGNKKIKTNENAVFFIPTNRYNTNQEEFGVTMDMIAEWQDAYQSVDVREELVKIRAWSLSNDNKRKTIKGMKRFINAWLSRAHDKGGSQNRQLSQRSSSSTKNITTNQALSDSSWAF